MARGHIAEVDPDTGAVEVLPYCFVDDFGTVINPLLVDGQAHGGIVQGIGQALLERTVYGDGAIADRLLRSYMDYAMSRTDDAPSSVNACDRVPATTNPLGASEVINYTETPDWDEKGRDLSGGAGVDCVVEIGGPGTIAKSLNAFAAGGHISLIGASLSRSECPPGHNRLGGFFIRHGSTEPQPRCGHNNSCARA